jgi:hypothetical protein
MKKNYILAVKGDTNDETAFIEKHWSDIWGKMSGLHYSWFFTRALSAVIVPFVPASFIAHIQIAIARKPLSSERADTP